MTKPKRKTTVQKNIKEALQARLDAEKAYKDMIGEAGGQLIERIITDNEGVETLEDVTAWYEKVTKRAALYTDMVNNKKAKELAELEKKEAEAKMKADAEAAKAAAEKAKTSGEGQPKPTPTVPAPGAPATGSSTQVTMQPRPTQPVNGSQQRT